MTSRFLLYFLLAPEMRLGGLPGRLWPDGFMENGTLMVLFEGCDTNLVDPGGSLICVADGGRLHRLWELLANPGLDRTELRVPVVLSDAVASNEGLLGEYESDEPKLGRDLVASDSDMDGKWPITLGR